MWTSVQTRLNQAFKRLRTELYNDSFHAVLALNCCITILSIQTKFTHVYQILLVSGFFKEYFRLKLKKILPLHYKMLYFSIPCTGVSRKAHIEAM